MSWEWREWVRHREGERSREFVRRMQKSYESYIVENGEWVGWKSRTKNSFPCVINDTENYFKVMRLFSDRGELPYVGPLGILEEGYFLYQMGWKHSRYILFVCLQVTYTSTLWDDFLTCCILECFVIISEDT